MKWPTPLQTAIYVITGLIYAGAIFDAINNTKELITPLYTSIGTLVGMLVLVFSSFLQKNKSDDFISNAVLKEFIEFFSPKRKIILIGIISALWIPRIGDFLRKTPDPASLEITHEPNIALVRPNEPSIKVLDKKSPIKELAYVCYYKTSVKAHGSGVTIKEFGALTWENDDWKKLQNNTGKPFTQEDFAEWYSCPGAYIRGGEECVDQENWTANIHPFSKRIKWYYVGIDDNGNTIKSGGVVECIPEQSSSPPESPNLKQNGGMQSPPR